MPRALLLSPDDQAVSAITGVLEEMSVTCERPLDGASAAQKLNSHSFDLVLVDCENLPAAKLIFDVCRRGNNGNNPVPIAIVDGRAGLPTAFRLGAELILTKPVAKDQARTTIRTAVSRVRKDVPANETAPEQSASSATTSAVTTSVAALGTVMPSTVKTEEHALAAAAASSQLTSFADPAPVAAPTAVPVVAPTSAPTATLSAPPLTTKMRSAVDEDETVAQPTAPKLDPPSTPSLAPPPSLPKSPSAPAVAADSKPARPAKPFEDPVLAELEESELKSSRPRQIRYRIKTRLNLRLRSFRRTSNPSRIDAVRWPRCWYSFSPAPPSMLRGHISPDFEPSSSRSSLDCRLTACWLSLESRAHGRARRRRRIPRRLRFSRLQPQALRQPRNPPPIRPSDNHRAPASAAASTATSAAATPVQPVAAPRTEVATPTSAATTTPAPVVAKPEAAKPADSKKDAAAAPVSAAQLPGENSAIILSSKGAERRLAHSVQPNFPVEARSGQAQGTVVLKEVVDQNGKVEGVRLVEGNATLATAAIQAVKQWRYRPYVRDGKAQPFQTIVIVDFQRP